MAPDPRHLRAQRFPLHAAVETGDLARTRALLEGSLRSVFTGSTFLAPSRSDNLCPSVCPFGDMYWVEHSILYFSLSAGEYQVCLRSL